MAPGDQRYSRGRHNPPQGSQHASHRVSVERWRTPTRPAGDQRRRTYDHRIAGTTRHARRCPGNSHIRSRSSMGNLPHEPASAVQHRRQHKSYGQRRRDRPPAAITEDPVPSARMPGGEQALEELLAGEDRDQRGRAHQPHRRQRQREPSRRRVTRERSAQRPQEPTDNQCHQQHQPWHDRMQIRMPRALQLDSCVAAERQPIPQLMYHERRGRKQRNIGKPGDPSTDSRTWVCAGGDRWATSHRATRSESRLGIARRCSSRQRIVADVLIQRALRIVLAGVHICDLARPADENGRREALNGRQR
jgi:hypothetical protein